MSYHTIHFIFTNPLHQDDPNYEILYTSKMHIYLTVMNLYSRSTTKTQNHIFSNFFIS